LEDAQDVNTLSMIEHTFTLDNWICNDTDVLCISCAHFFIW